MDGARALAVHRAETVGARVPAADDDHALACARVMKRSSGIASPSQRRFCSVRYSMAKWMPASSRPGIGRSRGAHGSAAEQQGVELSPEIVDGDVDADVAAGP